MLEGREFFWWCGIKPFLIQQRLNIPICQRPRVFRLSSVVGLWYPQVWFSRRSASLWFQITAVLFSSFSNTSPLRVRTTFSEHLHSLGVFGFLKWCYPGGSAHKGFPSPDSLATWGHLGSCLMATPNFLSWTRGRLKTGSGFPKYSKKKADTFHTFYLAFSYWRGFSYSHFIWHRWTRRRY